MGTNNWLPTMIVSLLRPFSALKMPGSTLYLRPIENKVSPFTMVMDFVGAGFKGSIGGSLRTGGGGGGLTFFSASALMNLGTVSGASGSRVPDQHRPARVGTAISIRDKAG